jgi:hypothetical protein
MSALARAFVVLALITLPPSASSAVPVDINYAFTTGGNSSGSAGGNDPVAGTWTVRWNLASLNGSFLNSVESGNVFALAISTIGGPVALPAFAAYQVGTPLAAAIIAQIVHPPFIFATAAANAAGIHELIWYADPFADFRVFGSEVNRSLVPEPTTGTLLALGLAGLAAAGGRTGWRRRQRTRD